MRSQAQPQLINATPIGGEKGTALPLAVFAAILACALACLGIGASAAGAAPVAQPGYGFIGSFGAGDTTGTFSIDNTNPIATDSDGNLFRIDGAYNSEGNPVSQVVVYAPGGAFLTRVDTPGQSPTDLAVDRVNDALYVQDQIFGAFTRRYLSNGAPIPTYTLDPTFSVPPGNGSSAIAVDPTTRDLLVNSSETESINRYDQAGSLVESIPVGFPDTGMAVAPDGTLYLLKGGSNSIVHLSGSGTPLGEIDAGGEPKTITVDPTSGAVVVRVGAVLKRFSPTGAFQSETPAHSANVGLAIDPATGRLYEYVGVGGGQTEISMYDLGTWPGVEAPVVTVAGPETLHVTAEVDPGAGPPAGSEARFEYSKDAGATWVSTPSQPVAAAGTVAADIPGLEPGLEYLVRAVAFNSLTSHTSAPSALVLPSVAPLIKPGTATDVSETTAVLNGTINPGGLPTTYYFEYGTTAAYGSRVPGGIEGAAGNGRVLKSFSRLISGLAPGTIYHFRVVATNALGTTQGPDQTFTTVVPGGIPPRAYEQVTPDKRGAAIIPRLGVQASRDGDGFSYGTKTGSESSPLVSRSVALRGSDNWRGRIDTDPPTSIGQSVFLILTTLAVSDDFTKALVASNRALAPGAIEGGANLYVRDIVTGTYRFVAASSAPDAFNALTGSKTQGVYLGGAPDLSWVVFSSPGPMLPGAPKSAIYRWSEAGGLELVSMLPNGEMSAGMRGSSAQVYKSVSADGSHIYYTAYGAGEEGVFLRQNGGPPKLVSHLPGDPTGPQPAVLLSVSESGRYAFISSSVALTADSPGTLNDLYRYDAVADELEYLGAQAYVNIGPSPNGALVEFGSYGTGADGETLYFSDGSFGLGALSVWHDGTIRQILPTNINLGFERPSPNGRYYVVQETVAGVPGVVEVYDSVTDQLSCASCLPDGTPVSGQLPEAGEVFVSNRYPQAVDDSGNVYFDTEARLVAADVNGTRDVYVYRDGIVRLISPGNRPFDAIFADISADSSDIFFTTAQKLVGQDNDESIDVYDARVNGGLAGQNPPPPQECLRDDCKATPNAGPELPFGGSEALSGPGNVTPKKSARCGKGKVAKKVKGKGKKAKATTKCVKKKTKAAKRKAGKDKKGGNR